MPRRGPFSRARAVAFTLALATALVAPEAAARSTYDSPYDYRQTFGSALRLVKVDLDLSVTETNADWGYFLFEYRSPEAGKEPRRGSCQFVEVDGSVQVSVDLADMPSYHEQLIVDKLKRKLIDEHGDPPKRAKPEKPKKKPRDGDKPKDEDEPKDGENKPPDDERDRS